MRNVKSKTRQLTAMAMITAMAFILTLLCHFIMPPLVEQPPLKLDLKDAVIAMAGFMMGPLAAFCISVVVSFVEMITISTTGVIGFVMNVLASCAFACTASFIYKKLHTKSGAIISLLAGTVATTIVMLLWNYIITPIYMIVDRKIVASMLLPVFLPFNLLKGGINTALTLLLYKPLVTALRKSRYLPEPIKAPEVQQPSDDWERKVDEHFDAPAIPKKKIKLSVGIYLFAAGLLITCILLALVLTGII